MLSGVRSSVVAIHGAARKASILSRSAPKERSSTKNIPRWKGKNVAMQFGTSTTTLTSSTPTKAAYHPRMKTINKAVEEAINDHINAELCAFYTYLSLSAYFSRTNVALSGFHAYFLRSAEEEKTHGMQLVDYLNKRGGVVRLQGISAPPVDVESPLAAMEKSLQMEEEIYEKLLNLHKIAGENCDPNFCDFIESTFLNEQVQALKNVSDLVTNLRRLSASELGVYIFDKQLAGTLNAAELNAIAGAGPA